MAAVITFTTAACGGDGDGDNNPTPQTVTYSGVAGETTYTLKITENPARYTAKSGDSYVLTVGSKKSTGTVVAFVNGVLTLKPSNSETTFTATVLGNSLKGFTGSIKWDGETTETKLPENLTSGGGDDGSITIGNWEWTAYGDSNDNGTSTITMTRGTGADSNKLTFSGNVTNAYQYGYAGVYLTPNETELTKLRTASSVSFKVKGDSSTYRFSVQTNDISDYSYYRKEFTADANETLITIYYSDLTRPSWGQKPPTSFVRNNIKAISIDRLAEHGTGAFNLTIWDLKLDNEDNDNGGGGDDGITIGNWKWTVFNDSLDGGTSTITMTRGTGADSNKLTFSGKVTNAYQYGYAGIDPQPNDKEFAKLKTASYVSFKVKGDGGRYRFIARTSDITDYSDYRKEYIFGTSETTITINLKNLDRPGWGQSQSIPFNQNNLTMINIQRLAEHGTGAFNLTVWDLKLDND